MIAIQFPLPEFQVKNQGGKNVIFDGIRKTWIQLTEEEWVRQNFVAYLLRALHYPGGLIAVEKEINLNGLKKRFDILVYDKEHRPWMLVECKAPQVALNEEVLQQALRYNISVPVRYIVITNGAATVAWEKVDGQLAQIEALPERA